MRLLRVNMITKTYLKKFITYYEGEMPRIDNTTAFSRYVFSMLEKRVIRDADYVPKWLGTEQNRDRLTMLVTERTFTHIGHTISPEKALYINAHIKDSFDFRLTISACHQHYCHGLTIKKALEAFCHVHGIEVDTDISMDNLLKIWHRTITSIEPAYQRKNVTSLYIAPFDPGKQLGLF